MWLLGSIQVYTLEGLKPAVLRSQFNLQLKSAHLVSLCKLILFLVTIFRTMEKVLSLDAFESGMHRSDFINSARLLKIRSTTQSGKSGQAFRIRFGPEVDKKFGLNSGLKRAFCLGCTKI